MNYLEQSLTPDELDHVQRVKDRLANGDSPSTPGTAKLLNIIDRLAMNVGTLVSLGSFQFPRNPDRANGWIIDYRFLSELESSCGRVSLEAGEKDETPTLRQIEDVLLLAEGHVSAYARAIQTSQSPAEKDVREAVDCLRSLYSDFHWGVVAFSESNNWDPRYVALAKRIFPLLEKYPTEKVPEQPHERI